MVARFHMSKEPYAADFALRRFRKWQNAVSSPAAKSVAYGSFDMWNRATIGFRRIDGRWLITHLHSSVPFYMDGSFRAAVDLKP